MVENPPFRPRPPGPTIGGRPRTCQREDPPGAVTGLFSGVYGPLAGPRLDLHALHEEAIVTLEAARRAAGHAPSGEAFEFVRFCYRRRRIGWPELYDEMCVVAARGLYQGWGAEELSAAGIGLSLFEMPRLAALASRVIAEEARPRTRESGSGREEPAPRLAPGTI